MQCLDEDAALRRKHREKDTQQRRDVLLKEGIVADDSIECSVDQRRVADQLCVVDLEKTRVVLFLCSLDKFNAAVKTYDMAAASSQFTGQPAFATAHI